MDPADRPDRGGGLAIYAAAAGLASAVPVPVLDTLLGGLARGAAMRRVAARHGVRLSRDARRLLAHPPPAADRRVRLARRVLTRVVAPLRVIRRVEEGLGALAAARLFDHYLRTSDRRPGAPLEAAEAARVRAAIGRAAVEGAFDSARDAPGGFYRTARDAVATLLEPGSDDRTPLERVVDTLLDAAADAPDDVGDRVLERFDAALREVAS